jgi:hypothetical protein
MRSDWVNLDNGKSLEAEVIKSFARSDSEVLFDVLIKLY